MDTVTDLLTALKSEALSAQAFQEASDCTSELSELMVETIQETLSEIKRGADSEDFSDLVVINFIIQASALSYSGEAIKKFVHELKHSPKSKPITFI